MTQTIITVSVAMTLCGATALLWMTLIKLG